MSIPLGRWLRPQRGAREPLNRATGVTATMAKAEVQSRRLQRRAGAEELGRELRAVLQDLQRNLRGLIGSMLVDHRGDPLVWELRGGVEPMFVSLVGSLLAQASERTVAEMDLGLMRNTVVTTEQGALAVFRVSDEAFLVLVMQATANNVLVAIEAQKAIVKLREVMGHG